LVNSLSLLPALTNEQRYRLRYLHRGGHGVPSAIQFVRDLRINLGLPVPLADGG